MQDRPAQSAHVDQAVPGVLADPGDQSLREDHDQPDPQVLQVRAALQRLGVREDQLDRLALAAQQPHAALAGR